MPSFGDLVQVACYRKDGQIDEICGLTGKVMGISWKDGIIGSVPVGYAVRFDELRARQLDVPILKVYCVYLDTHDLIEISSVIDTKILRSQDEKRNEG
jgi:hypothetical protein